MNKPLSVIFAGTPDFAVPSLQALIDSEHKVCAVYTQPDRRAGRGLKSQSSPVKQLALAHQLSVFQPDSLKESAEQHMLKALSADIMVVVAYGLLLPPSVLSAPRLGCINVHASLLPRWRGAAPIPYVIAAGDSETGVTIMQMDAGLDTGPMLNQIQCPVHDTDTAADLSPRLAKLGAEALLIALSDIQLGRHKLKPQDNLRATFAKKLTKAQAQLDWRQNAVALERQVRAYNPWPVAWSTLQGQVVRFWLAQRVDGSVDAEASPGQIVHVSKKGIDIATGQGILRVLRLQLAGGKRLTAAELLNAKGQLFTVGHHFE